MRKIHPKLISYGIAGSGLFATLALLVATGCSNESASAGPNFVYKDAPKPGVVAKINGEEVTEEQLIGEDKLAWIDIKKKEYEFKMAQLNKRLAEVLIGAEAKKKNMSTEEFIAKNVLKGDMKISDSEYNKFVKEKKIPESQINPQLKERINTYLKEQKKEQALDGYIAKLTKSSPVEVYFTKPKLSMEVDVGEAPLWGDTKATVTIVEFSDFQCPFCSRGAEVVQQIKDKFKGKVKIAFKQLPLPMHPDAKPAAEASMCVNEQNKDKFWKFHDLAFKNQSKLTKDDLEKYAKEVGANMDEFKKCTESHKYAEFIAKDMAYAEKLGVRSTPTFFVNGQLVAGALPFEEFSKMINEELAAKK